MQAMTINQAVAAIEEVLSSASSITSWQVRPSGDDVDVIKIWVELDDPKLDTDAFAKQLEAELRKQVPGAAAFRLHVRAESL
jgi:hypothetical protein